MPIPNLLPPSPGESRRIPAFALSLVLHAGAVYAFGAVSPILFSSDLPVARILREEVDSRKWRVMYIPRRLPDITPAKEIGREKAPQGRELSPDQVMISYLQRSRPQLQAQRANQPPTPQLKQNPAPPAPRPAPPAPAARPAPEAPKAAPAAAESVAANVPAPAPRPAPKAYVFAPRTAPPPAAVLLPVEEIQLAAQREPALPVSAGINQKLPGKPYVVRQTAPVAAAPVLLPVEEIEIAGGGNPAIPPTSGVGLGINQKLPAKPYVPGRNTGTSTGAAGTGTGGTGTILQETLPSLAGGGNGSLSGGNGSLSEGVAVGLAGDLTGLPSMSRAPQVGPTASGPVEGAGGVRIAGIMVRDRRPPPPKEPEQPKGKQYVHEATGTAINSLSLPLRPAARILPPAIERIFKGRVMYTAVIPKPNLPRYTGDWVLWFGEQNPQAGTIPRMRAPIPISKSMREPQENPEGIEHRFQILAVISPEGAVQVRSLLRGASHPMAAAVIEDLKLWTFKPALREGAPVEVEIVFEIPMRVSQRTPGREGEL